MVMVIIRFIVGIGLLILALLGSIGCIKWLGSTSSSTGMALSLVAGAGATILFHVLVDSLIARHAMSGKADELIHTSKYRMENKRLLSNGLIVTSGVIIGLAKGRSTGSVRLDTIFLAAGIIFGFINLSVHGGAVDDEVDRKVSKKTPEASDETIEETFKMIYVKQYHDKIANVLLNLQFLALILGIAALT